MIKKTKKKGSRFRCIDKHEQKKLHKKDNHERMKEWRYRGKEGTKGGGKRWIPIIGGKGILIFSRK